MKKYWERIANKIDALSLRDRAILFLIISTLTVMLVNTFVLDPQFAKQKQLSEKIKRDELQISNYRLENEQLQIAGKFDPDTQSKNRLIELATLLESADLDVAKLQKNLVKPQQMDRLLEDILKRSKGLQLISMESLPVLNLMAKKEPKIESSPSSSTNATPQSIPAMPATSPTITAEHGVYKHEVELVLEGKYLDMLAYMQALESMPQQLYWSESEMQVLDYPKARLRLRLFTLSLEKSWLNL
jgi:MSHA biogenesis protein MshJ